MLTQAEADHAASIITATGQDVPADSHLPEDYRFPEEYRDNAVQFRTQDGILLCGYILGEGSRGVTLGHPNGWMVKSWLPFAERLVDAGYMVILWEFRNIEPSGFAPVSASRRWDWDVLAAVQVLRERGAERIIAMGASDGGTATVIAAPDIPDLAGLGILSSPKDSVGDALEAVGKIKDVPAFFAVSSHDAYGDFYSHVKALYEACPSTQKELCVIEGTDHGTDMITPDVPGLGYASFPEDEAQVQKRQELADKLLLFVNETFDDRVNETDNNETDNNEMDNNETVLPSHLPAGRQEAVPSQEVSDSLLGKNGGPAVLSGIAFLLALVIILFIIRKRRR